MNRINRTGRCRRGATLAAALLASLGGAAQAQQPVRRDSARADSSRRTNLIPAGFGSLRQDDIAIQLQNLGLTVKAIPLDENVIRTLSPDSYRTLHGLRESKAAALDAIRRRMGLPSVQAWYVSYFNVEQGEARFDGYDFLVRNGGRDFRPLDVLPLTPRFGDGRLRQHDRQAAIYAFDPAIDLDQPITVIAATQQSDAWSDILLRIERERAMVWSRAGAAPRTKP